MLELSHSFFYFQPCLIFKAYQGPKSGQTDQKCLVAAGLVSSTPEEIVYKPSTKLQKLSLNFLVWNPFNIDFRRQKI